MSYSTNGNLPAAAPFDFGKSLRFIGGFGPMAGEQLLSGQSLAKTVLVDGQPILFEVRASGDAPGLDYALRSDRPIDVTTQRAAEDRIAFFLSLNDDLRPFYALAEDDPLFAPVARRLYGYHQVKFLTPFENAAWAVLTQRNAMPIARNMKRALVERYGARLEIDGQVHWAFPAASTLAQADPGELYDMLPNMRRAEYLQAAAAAFSDLDEGWLRAAPYDQVLAWLRGIRGIGEWSASFIALRGLGRMERLPLGEEKLASAASKLYGQGRKLAPAAIASIAARYGDYQGYWAHYLRAAS
jgi:DNA-3-methyladenine glycosylase II